MAKKIMYAKSNVEGDKKKNIYCGDLDKNDYETKYKGRFCGRAASLQCGQIYAGGRHHDTDRAK